MVLHNTVYLYYHHSNIPKYSYFLLFVLFPLSHLHPNVLPLSYAWQIPIHLPRLLSPPPWRYFWSLMALYILLGALWHLLLIGITASCSHVCLPIRLWVIDEQVSPPYSLFSYCPAHSRYSISISQIKVHLPSYIVVWSKWDHVCHLCAPWFLILHIKFLPLSTANTLQPII